MQAKQNSTINNTVNSVLFIFFQTFFIVKSPTGDSRGNVLLDRAELCCNENQLAQSLASKNTANFYHNLENSGCGEAVK